MKKIVEFFDKLEERLDGEHSEKKKRESMNYSMEKRIWGCFLLASFDLPMLIGQIFGFDARLYGVIMGILSFIPEEIFCHYLNKRIAAQETEEAAEDLNDDIDRISLIVCIVVAVMFFVLLFLSSK